MASNNDAAAEKSPYEKKIVIRSWPKIIFLYPTFFAALVAGVWQWAVGSPENAPADEVASRLDAIETIGLLFVSVFALNVLVIAFEFSRIKTVAILFLVVAVAFFALFMSTMYDIFPALRELVDALHLRMSTSFYFTMAGYFFLIYVLVFINTRWNYWVIRHNEIIHYTGFLGDIKRFPSPNLRMTKTIDDVFEFLLLQSGRITLFPASEREAIVLENVLGVSRAEREIKRLLSAIAVKISHQEVSVDD